MTDWIAETVTSDVGWDHLRTLVDGPHRMAGSDGERAAAAATRDALADAGARDAHLDTFSITGWTRGESAVGPLDGSGDPADPRLDYDCIALPRSPSGTVEGRLVDAGHGTREDLATLDLADAVVIVDDAVPDHYDRSVHRREKYFHAIEAGAAAFVFAASTPGGLAPTGSVGGRDDPLGPIPAVGVSHEVAARLTRRHADESIAVTVDAETGDAESQNVHATVGPDTDEVVLLTSHVDAHDICEGAMDNGAGTAMVVEVVRALAAREEALDTRVEAVCFGAEEVGLRGSGHAAEAVDTDAVKAVVNLDGVVRGRTLSCHTHGFDGLDVAVERVAETFDHPFERNPELGPHSDHWPFVARGVPGLFVHSAPEEGGRGWGHTRADTLDKLEVRTFREQAVLLTALVVEVARETTTVDHRDVDAIAADLDAQNLADGLRVTGDWPYED